MSVSVTEHTNVDLDAIVSGGDAFMARVKTLQKAKADNAAQLDALNIGRDAVAAMQNAQAREQHALTLVEKAKAEAESIVAAAKALAEKVRSATQTEIDGLLANAKSKSDTIEQEVKVARAALTSWTAKTQDEANALLAKANGTKAAADKQHADNKKTAEDLANAQAEAKAQTESANAKHVALNAKLEAISKVAAS